MRGVLLAGGTGSRLMPMTRVTNKHLLPIWDRPMLYWPLQVLRDNGIEEIMVISGREHMGDIFRLLGSGAEFGCRFTFRVQDAAGGIAEALGLARDFAHGEPIAAILGDGVYLPSPVLPRWGPGAGALVWLAEVPHPECYGVPVFIELPSGGLVYPEIRDIAYIEEKPAAPQTPYAVTGLYLYDELVFDIIDGLERSSRGELEITDVNNAYAMRRLIGGGLQWEKVPGYWGDAGTIEGLEEAAHAVRLLLGQSIGEAVRR